MIGYLIAMIVLGLLGAALSHYDKNYYVRVFDDILGREEDKKPETRVGRGFIYGFFFPLYFILVCSGLLLLIVFLILAGIVAAIVFFIVWITEKLLPHDWFGNLCLQLFDKIGLRGAVTEPGVPQPAGPTDVPSSGGQAPTPKAPEAEKGPEGPKSDQTP